MEWTWLTALLATAFVALGALLQAATGLGAGLIIVPLLALLSVELIPGPTIFASLALSLSMTIRGWDQIHFARTAPIVGGLLAGTIAASVYIARVPLDALGIMFGIFILTAVVISARVRAFALNKKGLFAAGAMSGVMGTSAGIGAPVLALVFQHYSGEKLRATLACLYLISSAMMLICLHFVGRFGAHEALSGVVLVPGFLIGYFVSPRLTAMLDRGYARTAVLVISTAAACLLIWRSTVLLMAC
jgi:uncharacterized protein